MEKSIYFEFPPIFDFTFLKNDRKSDKLKMRVFFAKFETILCQKVTALCILFVIALKYVTFHRKKVLPTCGNLREIPTTFPQLSRISPQLFPQNSRISQPAISRIPQLATCIFRFLHGGIYEIYET